MLKRFRQSLAFRLGALYAGLFALGAVMSVQPAQVELHLALVCRLELFQLQFHSYQTPQVR